MLTLTRKVTFSAGHVFRGDGLSQHQLEENFGIAALPSGHGHNYVLELQVRGVVDSVDGMVVNIKDMDLALRDLIATIDHQLINLAMPEFEHAVPTTERFAQSIWNRLPKRIGSAECLGLRLEEQPGMSVEVYGGNPAMIDLTCSTEFAASHRLHSDKLSTAENERIYGKCNNPNGHGHNYIVEITVRGEPDPRTGTVINLSKLESLLEAEIEARFDHKHLNLDTDYFKEQVASAENIAVVIWNLLKQKIPSCREGGEVALHRVRLIETARSWFDYYGK